jgi:8-oxo-dGTP pyrophosphatase MutT (NUDIX family)
MTKENKSDKDNSSRDKIDGAHVVFYRRLPIDHIGNKRLAVLLYKRTQDSPIHPGYWGLFGGKLCKHESAEDAVKREIKEELKIKNGDLQEMILLCDVKFTRGGDVWIRYYSSALNLDMDKLCLKHSEKEKKVEGEGIGWFTAEETHSLLMRPEDRIAVDEFCQKWNLKIERGSGKGVRKEVEKRDRSALDSFK